MSQVVRKKRELYEVMTEAISFMRTNPDVLTATVARHVGMSLSRFEHIFKEWVGTTPKRFRSYLLKEEAKNSLTSTNSVLRSAYATGLSSPTRLTELMITYEAISPGELGHGGLEIRYGVHKSPFGHCLIAVTKRGICQIAFLDRTDEAHVLSTIRERWPEALIKKDQEATHAYAERMFDGRRSKKPFHLLIKGTNFQIQVWEALLRIPEGQTSTYAAIAKVIGKEKAVRAVGTACGKNAIAYLIPCHRVLTSDGGLGGYRWGSWRKEALLLRESLRKESTS